MAKPTEISLETYDGKSDAEHILENVLIRKRWSVGLRDALAKSLVQIAKGQSFPSCPRYNRVERNNASKKWGV